MPRITFASTVKSAIIVCLFILIFTFENCDFCFSAKGFAVKFLICGLIILIGSFYSTKKFISTENLIFNIESQPILELHEAKDGLPFSGYGMIKTNNNQFLISPFSQTKCVYYHAIKEQYVKSGKSHHWVIVANLVNFVPFYLTDKKGRLKIDLTNLDQDFSGYRLPPRPRFIPDPKHSEIEALPAVKKQTSDNIRLTEYVLIPDIKVFAYGMVNKRDNELVLHETAKHPLIISFKTKERFIEEFYKGSSLTYLVHFLLAVGFTFIIIALNLFLSYPWLFYLLVLGNSAILAGMIFSIFNRLVTLKQRALTSLSNLEVELKRRTDLIPQIVEVVKQYTHHEQEL